MMTHYGTEAEFNGVFSDSFGLLPTTRRQNAKAEAGSPQ